MRVEVDQKTAYRRIIVVGLLLLGFVEMVGASHEATEPSDGTVRSFKPVLPPKPVPEIPFLDASGNHVTLSDFEGRVVLVNLWATWCPPCIRELPALERIQRIFSTQEFIVLPIATDREGLALARPFYEKLGIENLGLYADPNHALSEIFPMDVFPANFLLDRQGNMIAYLRSYVDWDAPEAEVMVKGLLHR